MSDERRLPESRLLVVLQITCATSAVMSLPSGTIHPFWLLAFIVPAAIFLFLGTGARQQFLPTWMRFALAALCQGAAALGTYTFVGPLDEKSALACSLLPALTYFTLRREPSDTSLSLFLSFCFLLIGIMLNHDAADWTLLVFLGACAWAMQIDAANRALLLRHAARGKAMPLSTRLLRRGQVIAGLMLAIFVGYQVLDLLPSPGKGPAPKNTATASSHGGRFVGLNSRFDLSGTDGSPLNLSADRVILATDPSLQPVPEDLYLRMTYFDRAGADEWRTWRPSVVENEVNPSAFYANEPLEPRSLLPIHLLEITRLQPSSDGAIYIPPFTIQITGIRRIERSVLAGHFRSTDPTERGYGLVYQRPHKIEIREGIDPNLTHRRLLELPPELVTQEIRRLAMELGGLGPKSQPPMALAQILAEGLEQRCHYELREPTGPYPDAIHNFLFGERHGYCMHFATALAAMLRIHGVPCRIAVGFHGGKAEDGNGRVFGSQHAHAWVEIPVKQFGWSLIDPTPPADRILRGWPDPRQIDDANALEDEDTSMSGASGFLAGLRDPLANPGTFLLVLLGIVCGSIGLVMVVVRRDRRGNALKRATPPTPDTIKARRWLEQILRVLARHGRPKNHAATLEQYLRVLRHSTRQDLTELSSAFFAYQEIRFGSKEMDPEREARLAAGLESAEDLEP